MNLTCDCDLDLDSVKVNQNAKYLGQRSMYLKAFGPTRRHTHTQSTALPGPLRWLVKTKTFVAAVTMMREIGFGIYTNF